MFAAGLVSISFREERPETILREAAAAGLSGSDQAFVNSLKR